VHRPAPLRRPEQRALAAHFQDGVRMLQPCFESVISG
jgi:hypothetical protein